MEGLTLLPRPEPKNGHADQKYEVASIIDVEEGSRVFFEFTSTLALPSGKKSALQRVPRSFYDDGFNAQIIPDAPALPGNSPEIDLAVPSQRMMEALGSNYNDQNFILLCDSLNRTRQRLWAGESPIEKSEMEEHIADHSSERRGWNAVDRMRRALAIINIYRHPVVHSDLIAVANLFREQLVLSQNAWNAAHSDITIDIVALWDEFIRDQIQTISSRVRDFVLPNIAATRESWAGYQEVDPEKYEMVMRGCSRFEREVDDLSIDVSGLT